MEAGKEGTFTGIIICDMLSENFAIHCHISTISGENIH